MRKFRYENPAARSLLQRARPYVFMFVGWNAIALLGWKYLNSKASEVDQSWETRSSAEKIVALTGSNPRTVRTKKISLFGSNEEDPGKDS